MFAGPPICWLWVILYELPECKGVNPSFNISNSIYKTLQRELTISISKWLKPVPILSKPTFNPTKNVSVIVPTVDPDSRLTLALLSWVATQPLEIIIVTTQENMCLVQDRITAALGSGDIGRTVLIVSCVPKAGKRLQLAHGIKKARGSVLVLADDDVFWQPIILHSLLACLEDPQIGGVGTRQRADYSQDKTSSVWSYLADRRLLRRNDKCALTAYCNNSVTCLSGRTACYRAHILKDPAFLHSFTHDFWLGYFRLDSGDDTFITRWLLAREWRLMMQVDPQAEIITSTLKSSLFLSQVLRWSRNSKRSSLRCIFTLPQLWRYVSSRWLDVVGFRSLIRPLQ